MSTIDDNYNKWKEGEEYDSSIFQNNKDEQGHIIDPISLDPISSFDDKLGSILIDNIIFKSSTLRRYFEISEYFQELPGVADDLEFIITFWDINGEGIKNPLTRQAFTWDQLQLIYNNIFEGTISNNQEFSNVSRRSTRGHGRKKSKKMRKKKSKKMRKKKSKKSKIR